MKAHHTHEKQLRTFLFTIRQLRCDYLAKKMYQTKNWKASMISLAREENSGQLRSSLYFIEFSKHCYSHFLFMWTL